LESISVAASSVCPSSCSPWRNTRRDGEKLQGRRSAEAATAASKKEQREEKSATVEDKQQFSAVGIHGGFSFKTSIAFQLL
jgi:hypothetical protein